MRSLKTTFKHLGFTLIELVMIIVIIGILLPVVLMPFISASEGIGIASGLERQAYVARANLSAEMAVVDSAWPAVDAYQRGPFSDKVDGISFTTAIKGEFVDAYLNLLESPPPYKRYLWITVETTEEGSGNPPITLNALKSQHSL